MLEAGVAKDAPQHRPTRRAFVVYISCFALETGGFAVDRQYRGFYLRLAYALTRRTRLAPPMLSRTRPPQPRVYVYECHPP
jgi:hypothetical protein